MAVTGLSLEELLAPERTIFLPSVEIVAPSLFIPSLWSNEILEVYKHNLVLANLLNRKYTIARQPNPQCLPIISTGLRFRQGSLQC
jgi:hypothetical protein